MWFFVSHFVAVPPKNSKDRGKETAVKAKNSGVSKRKEGGPSNGTPKKKKAMAAKAKIVSGGKPKATKTYDGMSVKKKETAAKTKSNEGGNWTSPDSSNRVIEKKQIKSYLATLNIDDMDPTAV